MTRFEARIDIDDVLILCCCTATLLWIFFLLVLFILDCSRNYGPTGVQHAHSSDTCEHCSCSSACLHSCCSSSESTATVPSGRAEPSGGTGPAGPAPAGPIISLKKKKKNTFRTMTQQRLNHLMILSVHKEKTDLPDINQLGNAFVQGSGHRLQQFGHF